MATTLVPLEEYLHTSYEPDAEYVNGVLVRRNVGTKLHSRLQALVVAYFCDLEKSFGIQVFPECRMSILGRYRIPDVMVLRFPHKKESVVTEIPLIVVEILSPNDESRDKLPFYAKHQVAEVWIADPHTRDIEVYVLRDGKYFIALPNRAGIIEAPRLGLELQVVAGPKLRITWAGGHAEI